MVFEFVGRKLHDTVDRLDDLAGEVGNGRENRPDDVVRVKTAFQRLGRLEEPERGFSGFIDRPLDGAIRSFQRANDLREDGFLRPGGPTQRRLQAQLSRIADAHDEPTRHRIDFDFISDREGGQQLEGYVPRDDRTGQPFPESGVTVATGFDVGQRSREDLDRLGLTESIQSKLEAYLGAKGSSAQRLLDQRPLRMTREEADVIDRLVRQEITNDVIRSFNRSSRFKFEDLPSAMQTVIASVGLSARAVIRDNPALP